MNWDKVRILQELRRLHRAGARLSYSHLARHKQSLLSAAAYHFGSYRNAIERAGIDYAELSLRPRWTKQKIIQLLKQARRKNIPLHWSAVTKGKSELAKAAFAAIQPRLFGRWDRALHAAGLDADEVLMYRNWDRNSIVFDLKLRAADDEPLNSGAVQRDDPGLHAAAVRYFGNYYDALRAARIDPEKHRQRRRWNKSNVISSLKRYAKKGKTSDTEVRRADVALYGAAVRLFGSFTKARKMAGIKK
jgi:hypothetical protein